MDNQSQITVNDIQKAIFDQALVLFYQPQYSLQTDQIIGIEALLRWRRESLSHRSTEQFILQAEKTRAIITLGYWVLREACLQVKQWQDAGIAPFRMAVNLSPVLLHEADFVDQLEAILTQTQVLPDCLEIEITEHVPIKDKVQFNTTMHVLDRMGVLLSIDDFGTGHSAIEYVTGLPYHRLKIDRSLITDIHTNLAQYQAVKSIIDMGHAYKMQVIAEGIEKQEQRHCLCRLGCDAGQGFYYNKAMSAAALGKLLGHI